MNGERRNSTENVWVGCDLGGKGSFGVAWIGDFGGGEVATVSSVQEAVEWIPDNPSGLGVDAPLWWSSDISGRREADDWIRSEYSIASGTVQTTNSLRGAAVVQGPLLVELCRSRFRALSVTEPHPKALLKALKTNWEDLARAYKLNLQINNEHERDAAIGALAAREGFSGRWTLDLSVARSEYEQDPKAHWISAVHYVWPAREEVRGRSSSAD